MKNFRPNRRITKSQIVSCIVLLLILIVSADVLASGGLSTDGLNPTNFDLSNGSNPIAGMVNSYPDVRYFRVVVPTDHELTAINLTTHTNGDSTSWFAAMAGPQFTETSTNSGEIDVSKLLAHAHIGTGGNTLPYNVLPSMGITTPLSAGTYSFRIQNWGTGIQFSFDFDVVNTPPSSVTLNQAQVSPSPFNHAISLTLLVGIVVSFLTIQLRNRQRAEEC